MVARITTPYSIHRALSYHEKKVQKGVAKCLYAGNFLQDASHLNFYEKGRRFERLNVLNKRAKTNTLHISLNFHPAEKLGPETLVEIAAHYMEKIGFGNQPYLVYQHCDAGHPHLHIVTTTIQETGRRIDTYNIGRNRSEQARTELEVQFGLVKATGEKQRVIICKEPAKPQKVKYGFSETKRSITEVLEAVLNQYHYASLSGLNAVLKTYNVRADRGKEGRPMYRHQGLVFRILDENGKAIGVPVKASSISFKPTLPYLAQQFKKGEQQRAPYLQKLKTAIDWVLHNRPESTLHFVQHLQAEGVQAALAQNGDGFVYDITFIDGRTKCVFTGSELGAAYSAAAIRQRLLKPDRDAVQSLNKLLEKPAAATKRL